MHAFYDIPGPLHALHRYYKLPTSVELLRARAVKRQVMVSQVAILHDIRTTGLTQPSMQLPGRRT